ncbi:hypothetical protein SAMN05216537_11212 [Lachnospira multipara]|uniref:Uncharacterized protein n=1 Tax=Lachnospira multipara TaxID=28051 RepID=A0A1H5VQ04_9FIRM|nr:hypothetical protein SAMN05216537_11212 [Lachnospira multipara]
MIHIIILFACTVALFISGYFCLLYSNDLYINSVPVISAFTSIIMLVNAVINKNNMGNFVYFSKIFIGIYVLIILFKLQLNKKKSS